LRVVGETEENEKKGAKKGGRRKAWIQGLNTRLEYVSFVWLGAWPWYFLPPLITIQLQTKYTPYSVLSTWNRTRRSVETVSIPFHLPYLLVLVIIHVLPDSALSTTACPAVSLSFLRRPLSCSWSGPRSSSMYCTVRSTPYRNCHDESDQTVTGWVTHSSYSPIVTLLNADSPCRDPAVGMQGGKPMGARTAPQMPSHESSPFGNFPPLG
jgi:hypothetical protein